MDSIPLDLIKSIFTIRGGFAWAKTCKQFRDIIYTMIKTFKQPYEIYGLNRHQTKQLKYLQLTGVTWYCGMCSKVASAPVCEDCSSYSPFIDVSCQIDMDYPGLTGRRFQGSRIRYQNESSEGDKVDEVGKHLLLIQEQKVSLSRRISLENSFRSGRPIKELILILVVNGYGYWVRGRIVEGCEKWEGAAKWKVEKWDGGEYGTCSIGSYGGPKDMYLVSARPHKLCPTCCHKLVQSLYFSVVRVGENDSSCDACHVLRNYRLGQRV